MNPSHAALSPEQRAFLDRLARCSLSDAAFLVALLAVSGLEFDKARRIHSLDLQPVSGLTRSEWMLAVDELVMLGAFDREHPRSYHRRQPAYRLGWRFRPGADELDPPRGDAS
ncbi:hypothetical protein P3T23_009614 [Paraburkholderia sp. GAS448]